MFDFIGEIFSSVGRVSDAASSSGSVNAKLAQLLARLTGGTWDATKAGYLDAAISSRAPLATALTNATWTDAKAGYLDGAISRSPRLDQEHPGRDDHDREQQRVGDGDDHICQHLQGVRSLHGDAAWERRHGPPQLPLPPDADESDDRDGQPQRRARPGHRGCGLPRPGVQLGARAHGGPA